MAITKEQRQEWGRKGGTATAEKYGASYMQTIAQKGYQTTVARHFGGDGIRCQNWLGKTRNMPRISRAMHGSSTAGATGAVVRHAGGEERW